MMHTISNELSALMMTGLLSVAFGVIAVFWPHLTMLTLVYLFASYILIQGVIKLTRSFNGVGESSTWLLKVILGLFELGVGVYLLRHVHVTFAVFIALVGFMLIARGTVGLIDMLLNESRDRPRIMGLVVGVLTLVAGVAILLQPAGSGVAFVWILGLYALLTGAVDLSLLAELSKA